MTFSCNVGGTDKAIRLVLGGVLVVLPLFVSLSATGIAVALVLAAIALATAFVGYCPVNQLVGLDTCGATQS